MVEWFIQGHTLQSLSSVLCYFWWAYILRNLGQLQELPIKLQKLTELQAQQSRCPYGCTTWKEASMEALNVQLSTHLLLGEVWAKGRSGHQEESRVGGMTGRGSCITLWTVCGRRKQQEASVSAHAVPGLGSTPVIPELRFSSSPNPCSQNRLGRGHVAYALYHITQVVSDLLGVASARHCSSCFHCFLPDPYNNSLRGV